MVKCDGSDTDDSKPTQASSRNVSTFERHLMSKDHSDKSFRQMAHDGFSSENLKAFARADGVSSGNLKAQLAQARAASAKPTAPETKPSEPTKDVKKP